MEWETTDDQQGLTEQEVVGIAATSGVVLIMTSVVLTVLAMCVLGGLGLACFQKQKQHRLRQRLHKFNNKVENLESVVDNDLEMLPNAYAREEPSTEKKLVYSQDQLRNKTPAERMQFLKEIQSQQERAIHLEYQMQR